MHTLSYCFLDKGENAYSKESFAREYGFGLVGVIPNEARIKSGNLCKLWLGAQGQNPYLDYK